MKQSILNLINGYEKELIGIEECLAELYSDIDIELCQRYDVVYEAFHKTTSKLIEEINDVEDRVYLNHKIKRGTRYLQERRMLKRAIDDLKNILEEE